MKICKQNRRFTRYFKALLAGGLLSALSTHAADAATEIRVLPGQTLNEAIAGTEGPLLILLPPGVTEHDAPITREATVVIRGQGREISTLRPSADVPLIAQGDLMRPFDGNLVLSDFTYDRAHRHVGDANPRAVIATNAGGDLIFRNFRTHRFNFDGRNTIFLRGVGGAIHRATPDSPRHRYVGFHQFEIDFAYDGGIRNRHTGRLGTGQLQFNAERFVFDANSVFRGHLMQEADPAQTVGDGGRGHAAPLGALRFNVWDYGLVDGEFRWVDYSVVRWGGVMTRDGVLEIRAHCPENGFADQFWPRAYLPGKNGHLIYDGVFLTSADGNLWHDRGFKAHGDWKSITVRNCFVSGFDAPIDFASESTRPDGTIEEQGLITITDTVIVSRRAGVDIGSDVVALEGVVINNLVVRPHPDGAGFIRQAVHLRESSDSRAVHKISNVLADGYISGVITTSVSPDSTLITENLHGRKGEAPVVEDAFPVATIPRRPTPIDGDRAWVERELEPVATLKDFGANREEFSRLDVYLTHYTPGIYLTVIVGTDSLSNTQPEVNNTWRGDALQFAITEGMPGEHQGYVLFDIARHDERGLQLLRRNFWADRDLPSGLIDLDESEIEMVVDFDEEAGLAIYQVLLTWEEINLPAPWYDLISIDLVATRGATHPRVPGNTWLSPYKSLQDGDDFETNRALTGGIFWPPTVTTRGFKAIRCQ